MNRNPPGYWTIEKLQEEANKYKSRWEFGKNSRAAYKKVLFNNLMDKLFKNHPNEGYNENHKKSGYWTIEKLQEEANKYKTRTEFQRNSRKAYSAAWQKDLIDVLFKNHPNTGYLNKEEWVENNYVIYVYELKEYNKAYVGLTNNIKRRDLEHIFSDDIIARFCKNNDISYPNYKILEKNLNSTNAQLQEKYWLDFYKDNQWEMFNSRKPGSLGTITPKWTKKALQDEVNKYKTRGEFQNYSSAHSVVASRKLTNELFKNHPNQGYDTNRNIRNYWTIEKLQEEANKCETRTEFYKNNSKAFSIARTKKILNELFKNHKNQGYILNIKKRTPII